MTRNEAYKAMIDGHKITHKGFIKDTYVYFDGISICAVKVKYNQTYRTDLSIHEDGYEIYQEPKKTEKVAWYRVSYHYKDESFPCTELRLYRSKEAFIVLHKYSENNFYWIKLEEVYTHEYEVSECQH